MNPIKSVIATIVVALGLAGTGNANTLWNVQFSGTAYSPVAQTGAAVMGGSGDVWNLFETSSGSQQPLVDATGAATAVTISWTADGTGMAPNTAGQFGFYGKPDANLMQGYLYTYTANVNTITVSGLAASARYTIYLYTQGDLNSGGRELWVATDLSTNTSSATVATASGFVAGQNYLVLTNITDASGTLTLTYKVAVSEADINGLQITPTPVAPTATTLAAGGITATNATLSGTVNPGNLVTTAWFQWGTTTNCGSATASTSLAATNVALTVTNLLTGLSPATTCYFYAVAANAAGTNAGAVQSFTTAGALPAVVTLAVASIGATTATLNGTVNPNGLATGVWFQWGMDTNYGSVTAVTSLTATNTTLAVTNLLTGLARGQTCHFRAVATNSLGTALGGELSFTTRTGTNTVTSLADDGSSGTLRQTIANALDGEIIVFATTGTIALTNGELVITNSLTFAGPGATNLAISGNGTSRVFNITSTNSVVTIADVTICNGKTATGSTGSTGGTGGTGGTGKIGSSGGTGGNGGGIYNLGNLTLNRCILSNNVAGNGGTGGVGGTGSIGGTGGTGGNGGNGGGVYNAGTLSVLASTLVANASGAGGMGGTGGYANTADGTGGTGGDGGNGGGVYSAGTLSVCFSTLASNSTGAGGNGGSSGTGGIIASTGGDSGSGGSGGSVYNTGTFSMLASTLVANSTGAGGSGGTGGAPGNSDGGNGGGASGGGNGGGVYNTGTFTVFSSTLVANSTGAGGNGGVGGNGGAGGPGGSGSSGGSGGGVYSAGNLSVLSCTLVANSTGAGGTGGTGGKGSVGSLAIGGAGGAGGTSGSGAGIYNSVTASSAPLHNSLTALNVVGLAGAGGAGGTGLGSAGAAGAAGTTGSDPDLAGAFISQGHNVVSQCVVSTGLTNAINNDLVGTAKAPINPHLGSLANNGGPTPTIALLPGSPAIDTGDDSLAGGTDQRGFPRRSGLFVDVGAYELNASDLVDFSAPAVTPATCVISNLASGLTSATFSFGINPNGVNTIATFRYGVTTNYGAFSSMLTMGYTNVYAITNLTLTPLAPGFTYHYCVSAVSPAGITVGADQTFISGMLTTAEAALVFSNYWATTGNSVSGLTSAGAGQFTFGLTNSAGLAFTVLASTNLTDWTALTNANPQFLFSDPAATNYPQRYYRLLWP